MGNQTKSNKTALKVYYDGLCKVCSKEINHYKKQRGANRIQFIDIFSSGFNAASEKLDPTQIHKVMHVRRQDGSVATRVDAFIEIWSILPKYQWLARIAKNRLFKSGLEMSYSCFALVRPFLPRYADSAECQDSPYCEVKK